jgi:hypothetical protein
MGQPTASLVSEVTASLVRVVATISVGFLGEHLARRRHVISIFTA